MNAASHDRGSSPSGHGSSLSQICRLLTVVFALTMLVAAIPVVLGAGRVLGETADEIRQAQLRLASLAAAHADRGLTEAFYEIELMAIRRTSGPNGGGPISADRELRSVLGKATSFTAGVVVLDARGGVSYSEPANLDRDIDRKLPGGVMAAAAESDDRVISEPYVDPRTGDLVSALSLPLFTADGARQATIIGLFDVGGPLITDLVAPAFDLGASGHSDLVDAQGRIIAAINPAHGPDAGHHPGFYEAVALARVPTVETVSHELSSDSLDRSRYHVMAYAPLRMAPWGVAIGASEAEVMAGVAAQRRTMVVLGASSIGVLFAGWALFACTCRRFRRSFDDGPGPTEAKIGKWRRVMWSEPDGRV